MIQISPRRARAAIAAEAGALFGLLGACGGFVAALATALVRQPLTVALVGSCLVFALTTARWVSTGHVLPPRLAPPGWSSVEEPPPVPPGPPRGVA